MHLMPLVVAAFMLDQLTDRRYLRATVGLAD
jgi:hypothetical protein